MSTDSTPVGVTAETFDLMDWIESGTVTRRQVEIHNNPSLVEEYEHLEAQLAAAEASAKAAGGDEPMGQNNVHAELLERMQDLWERWEASKATWTVRALSDDDVQATFDPERGGIPTPKVPIPPPEKAGRKAADDFVDKVNAYTAAKAKADKERRLHLIAAAVVSVETVRGTATAVSVDDLRAIAGRPHGRQWIDKLYAAVEAATEGDVEIPRPTLPGRSTSDRG